MSAYLQKLACPTCHRRVWVRFGTDGNGLHTETWERHDCAPPPPPAPRRKPADDSRRCLDCGGSMEGIHGLAKRCWPCRKAWRIQINRQNLARRAARRAAAAAEVR